MTPKRKRTQDEPLENPDLTVPRAEAEENIEARIEDGENLLQVQPGNEKALRECRADRVHWSNYNTELLRRLFTNAKISDEYTASSRAGPRYVLSSFQAKVRYDRGVIQESLNSLHSILGRLELYREPDIKTARPPGPTNRGREVFLVHGHNHGAKETVARFLQNLGLNVTILHELPNEGRTVIEKFEDQAMHIDFAVILLTDDDVGNAKDKKDTLNPRARQNVILEQGYFIGKLGRKGVCALKMPEVEEPSDLSGVIYIPLDSVGKWRMDLAREIKAAGISVDLNKVS